MTHHEDEPQQPEKRSIERRHLVFYLRVYDRLKNEIMGHLADISTGGLMLVSDSQIKPDRDFSLRIKLPKEVVGRDEIHIEATSCWSKQDSNPDFYITGFSIGTLDGDLEKRIKILVRDFSREESLQVDDVETPVCNLTHTTGR